MQSMKKWFGKKDKAKEDAASPAPTTPADNADNATDAGIGASDEPEATLGVADAASTPAEAPSATVDAPATVDPKASAPTAETKDTVSESAPKVMTPQDKESPKSADEHKQPGRALEPASSQSINTPADTAAADLSPPSDTDASEQWKL
jgi:hypothetical protein